MDSMRVVIHFVIVQLARQVRGVPKKMHDQSTSGRGKRPMIRSIRLVELGLRQKGNEMRVF
jgi:hypothetical protein